VQPCATAYFKGMSVPFTQQSATTEPFRFTVEQFLLLNDEGFFGEHAKTELLGGEVFVVNAQYRPHARAKATMARALEVALNGSLWAVLTEVTILLSPDDAPEPDIVVTNEPEGHGAVPAASIALLVEICDTTHATDLKVKPRRYAASGIPEYWVIDLVAREITRHSAPGMEGYEKVDPVEFGKPVIAATMPGVEVATDGLG